MTTLILALSLGTAMVQGSTTSASGGLQLTTFNMKEGSLRVYLPSDLAPGDTMSGTVIAEPMGTGNLLERNSAVLEGLVVVAEDQRPARSGKTNKWLVPAAVAGLLTLTLIDSGGRTVGTAEVPTLPMPAEPNLGAPIHIDPIVAAGSFMHVNGPFDGDVGNTGATVDGNPITIVAESPRSCVMAGLPNVPGQVRISVSERGTTATAPVNCVQLKLSAPKTTLMAGEETSMTITVSGLAGLAQEAYPIPVEILN